MQIARAWTVSIFSGFRGSSNAAAIRTALVPPAGVDDDADSEIDEDVHPEDEDPPGDDEEAAANPQPAETVACNKTNPADCSYAEKFGGNSISVISGARDRRRRVHHHRVRHRRRGSLRLHHGSHPRRRGTRRHRDIRHRRGIHHRSSHRDTRTIPHVPSPNPRDVHTTRHTRDRRR